MTWPAKHGIWPRSNCDQPDKTKSSCACQTNARPRVYGSTAVHCPDRWTPRQPFDCRLMIRRAHLSSNITRTNLPCPTVELSGAASERRFADPQQPVVAKCTSRLRARRALSTGGLAEPAVRGFSWSERLFGPLGRGPSAVAIDPFSAVGATSRGDSRGLSAQRRSISPRTLRNCRADRTTPRAWPTGGSS